MTDYASSGNLAPTLRTPVQGNLSTEAYTAPEIPQHAPELDPHDMGVAFPDPGQAPRGVGSPNQNIVDHQTDKAPGLDDIWFERILVVPDPLDFGPISGAISRDVQILNNYRRDAVSWTDFTNNSVNTEVDFASGILPISIPALGTITRTASVDGSGNPTVSGTLDFEFNGSEEISIVVLGTRARLFPFVPEVPVSETMQFRTDVLVARDGTEQRHRERRYPVQQIEFDVISDDTSLERDNLNSMLYQWLGRPWAVPLWWEARPLTTAIAADDVTIYVDTRYGAFRAGGLVAVIKDPFNYEILEIDSLTSSSITVSGKFANDWEVREVQVVPALASYMPTSISQNRWPLGPSRGRFQFKAIEGEYVGDASAFASYNSKVLINHPNMITGSTKDEGIRIEEDSFDPGVGREHKYSSWDSPKPLLGLRLFGNTLQECWEIRQLFHYLSGRWLSFYLPTGRKDLRPITSPTSGATSFDIEWMDFVQRYGSTPAEPRAHFQIVYQDGTTSQHQIQTATTLVEGTSERITFTPGTTDDLDNAVRIEFLTLSRLRADTVQVIHTGVGQAEFFVQTIGVPA